MAEPLVIGGEEVSRGSSRRLDLKVARLFTGDWLRLPVWVFHGARPGPALWLDAAIHGDELNGMEIIRQVVAGLDARKLAGTVLAVPVVNIFGFVQGARYLPDRRDLNRSFPGSASGSLAARLAHLVMREVVSRCEYGIDLHTGSNHRSNLAQVRADLGDAETRRIAFAFGAPLVFDAPTIGGSLRAVARRRGIHILVFEGGEPLRFDPEVIEVGVSGVRRVLAALGMVKGAPEGSAETVEATARKWVRASRSGIFYCGVEPGERVSTRQVLGRIVDLLSDRQSLVRAPFDGIVIGFTHNPLAHQGDALVHLARAALPVDRGESVADPQSR